MRAPTLHDAGLVLRPKRLADAEAITAAYQDPEIPRWTFVPSPYSLEDARSFLKISAEEEEADTGELARAPRSGAEEPVFAVYAWTAT
jgi:RimJ/RimL family protein N-acetyltransferase